MQFASKLDIPLAAEDRNLAIALGGLTEGVTPLQMAQAYSAFANQGQQNKAHSITKILDSEDREIYSFKSEKKQVMGKKTAYYMTLLMQSVVEPKGTGANARMKRPVAGKTGSTQVGIKGMKGNRDIWFVGYTPEWTAAVWMGFDKTDENHYLRVGSGYTANLFREVMSKALADRKITSFIKPDDAPDLAQPPSPVTDLSASYEAETPEVQLKWTPIEGKVEYRLYRKADTEEKYSLLLSPPTPDVRDITVQHGAAYQYYVVAYHTESGLESKPSNIVEVIIPEESLLDDPLGPILDGEEPSDEPAEEPSTDDPALDPSIDPSNSEGDAPGNPNGPDPNVPDGNSEVPDADIELPIGNNEQPIDNNGEAANGEDQTSNSLGKTKQKNNGSE